MEAILIMTPPFPPFCLCIFSIAISVPHISAFCEKAKKSSIKDCLTITDRIRRMGEGNVFSLFTPRGYLPWPSPDGGYLPWKGGEGTYPGQVQIGGTFPGWGGYLPWPGPDGGYLPWLGGTYQGTLPQPR